MFILLPLNKRYTYFYEWDNDKPTSDIILSQYNTHFKKVLFFSSFFPALSLTQLVTD